MSPARYTYLLCLCALAQASPPPSAHSVQNEDPCDPPDKGNPDCLLLHSVFFEFPSSDAMAHCTNDKKGDDSTEQCVCARAMRSQVYRSFGLAMGVTGAGNQQRWGKVVPSVVRAAWDYPEPSKTKPCPPLDALHIHAFDWEPTPTREEAEMFVELLERLGA